MRWIVLLGVAGCSRTLEPDLALLPPPETDTLDEHVEPGSFDPCPLLEVDAPLPLSASAAGVGPPRIGWNADTRGYVVLWREDGRLAYRFLDEEGNTVGLEGHIAGWQEAPVVGDPAVVGVAGLAKAGFYLTIQTAGRVEVARLFTDGEVDRDDAILGNALDRRRTALAWDGGRLAIAYALDTGDVRLVSYEKSGADSLRCASDPGEPADVCGDDWFGGGRDPTVGSLGGRWIMAYRARDDLSWIELEPPAEGVPYTVELGEKRLASAARLASADRRLAVAFRVAGEPGDVTEVWQVSDTDGDPDALLLASPELSAGTPAICWGHGRRLAVAGLWERSNGERDVVLFRADAPVPSSEPQASLDLDPVQVSQGAGAGARDPDIVFSGSAYGVTWAQDDDVWFALARCAP